MLLSDQKYINTFFALLRAGLWEAEVHLLPFGEIDFCELLLLAEEQSVVGLVAAGIEHVTDMNPAKTDVFQFIGQTIHGSCGEDTCGWDIHRAGERARSRPML